jgi:hypothetical protein
LRSFDLGQRGSCRAIAELFLRLHLPDHSFQLAPSISIFMAAALQCLNGVALLFDLRPESEESIFWEFGHRCLPRTKDRNNYYRNGNNRATNYERGEK